MRGLRALLILLLAAPTCPRSPCAAWLAPAPGAPNSGRGGQCALCGPQPNRVTVLPTLRPRPSDVAHNAPGARLAVRCASARGDLFAHVLINKEIMAAAKSGSLGELCDLVELRCPEFNQVNAATAYKWLLLMRSTRGARQQPLKLTSAFCVLESALLEEHVSVLGARECSNVLHAMAKTRRRLPSPQLLSALARRVREIVPQLNSQGVANMLWALATLRTKPRAPGGGGGGGGNGEQCVGTQPEWARSVSALARRAEKILWDFKPQEVANLLWALAQMRRRPERGLVGALERRLEALGVCLNSQDVANILWYVRGRTGLGET
jgi:hypothetical protein